jgi:hypothetical protein
MNYKVVEISVASVFAGLVLAIVFFRRRPRKLKRDRFVQEWRELQSLCRVQTTWPDALKEADRLLNKALKKRKFKGRTIGSRMVNAQRSFTDNDAIWYAHNLTKKVLTKGSKIELKQSDIKQALINYREALGDLGALPRVKRKSY